MVRRSTLISQCSIRFPFNGFPPAPLPAFSLYCWQMILGDTCSSIGRTIFTSGWYILPTSVPNWPSPAWKHSAKRGSTHIGRGQSSHDVKDANMHSNYRIPGLFSQRPCYNNATLAKQMSSVWLRACWLKNSGGEGEGFLSRSVPLGFCLKLVWCI